MRQEAFVIILISLLNEAEIKGIGDKNATGLKDQNELCLHLGWSETLTFSYTNIFCMHGFLPKSE